MEYVFGFLALTQLFMKQDCSATSECLCVEGRAGRTVRAQARWEEGQNHWYHAFQVRGNLISCFLFLLPDCQVSTAYPVCSHLGALPCQNLQTQDQLIMDLNLHNHVIKSTFL